MNNILSQEEVNALLRGISGSKVETEAEVYSEPGEVMSYDLTCQDRIIRNSRMTKKHEDIFAFLQGEINELKEDIYLSHKNDSLNRELAEIKASMNKLFDLLGMRKGKAAQDINQKSTQE